MNNKKILLLVCLLALTMMVLVACGAEPEITDTTTLPPTSQTSSSTSSSSSSSSTSSSQSTTSLPPFPEFDDGQCYNHARNRNPLTCDGTTECSVCGEPLAAIAHMYAYPGVYTEGDCQTLGYTTHKCMLCGETMRVDDEDFASHHYEGDGCTVCGASALVTVEKTEFDEVPMPDRYNTGANNVTVEYVELTKVYTSGIYNGVSITYNNGTYSLNPANSEKEGNTIYIDNLDFSYGDKFYAPPHNGYVIHFRNCILNEIQGFRSGAENCQYIFEDCNLIKFGGSNATLIDVNFGGADDRDGIVPFQNVTAINCYVGDKAPINYQRELHTDAIQIYGYGMKKRETEAVNLHFYNFRAEMPSIPYTGSHSYMNSCLMVSLDYNNGYNITFTHCYVNGTGCPVMIWDNPHPDYIEGYPNHTPNYMKDVVYTDIRSGCGSQLTTLVIGLESEESAVTLGNKTYGKGTSAGKVYSSMPENFEIKTDTLLVGSVWEKDGKTHVSVTNDTSKIRTLAVVTSAGTVHRLTVDRFPLYFELERDLAFTELPIDIDFAIDGTYDWIACFDTTEGQFRQIRFVSKTEETVEINSSILFDHRVENGEVYEIAHGMLSGTSTSDREAADKQAKMNGVFFNITSDGTMLIYGYTSDAEIKSLRNYSIGSYNKADYMAYADLIKHVVIKPGITNIPAGMFKGMTSIETITLPSTVTTIGDEAFAGCYSLRSINIPYGMKRIGVKAFAECYALEEAVIPSTVTNVGARAFERCASLEKVVFAPKMSTLPDSIFNRCYALKEIVLTSNLTQIPSASFQNCISLEKLSFVGDEIALRSIAYTSRQNALFAEIHRGEVTYWTDDDLALLEDRTLKSREPQPTNSVNKTQVAKVYDGKPLTTNFTTDSDGEVTYKWMKGAMILDGAPCDAGRYTLVIKVAETEKFQAYEVHMSLYINPAPASLTITTPSLDKPFDGTPPEAPQFTTNSSGSVTVTWYVGNMACKEAPIAPGEYRVVVTVAANNNYGATSAQMKVTIGLPEGMSYWDGTTATGFAGGNGTQESPYQIATAEQLSYLAAMVNSTQKNAEFADKYYVLTQDIYLNQAASSYSGWTDAKVAPEGVNEWMSIGSTKDTKFKGHFDGQNHIIYGLYSRATEAEGETYHNGLFGYVETAAIENLIIRYGALVDTLANKHKSGYLAAFMDGGTYRNVYVRDVYTNGTTTVGGLFGEAQAKAGDALIENCHFNGELIGNNAGNFGGIIGSMNGGARGVYFTIRGCTTRGEIYARNGAAGMIGSVSTNINLLMEDCYNYANIEVWGSRASGMLTNASSTMGGLEVVIRQCVNYGDITVADDRAAGILSSLEPNNIPVTIENCANYGTITANQYAGGIVAYLAGTSTGSITMANNFSLGSVSATTYGNELIGYLNPGHAPLSIQNCGFIGNNFATNEGNLEGTVEVTPEDLRDYLEALNAYVAANLDAKPTLRPWILADHGLQFQGELRLDTNNLDKYVDDKPAETPSFTRLYGDGEIVITWWKGNEQLSGAATEPGDYRVVITMADTLAVKGTSVALDFALSAVGTPTLRINGIDKAYDGTPVALPEISTTNVDATPTFTFYRGEIGAGEKLDGAPTDAGTYYVVVSVPASNGFDAVEKSKAFVISKAQSVIEGLSNPTREYNGEAIKLPAYTYNGTAEVMVQFYRGTYKRRGELLEGAPTEVGNYVVIFTAPEETNYTGVEVYYDFRIDLITSFVSIEESLTKVATGEAISAPAYTTTQSGGEVTISWYDNEGNLLETAPSEAGFYEVVIRLAQNGNYSAAEASQAFELIATGQTWTGEIGVAC